MREEDESNIRGGETDMDLYAPVDSLVMSSTDVRANGLPSGTEIIWNLSAAKTMLDLAIKNILNGATASQFSSCKRARDILDETLHLL